MKRLFFAMALLGLITYLLGVNTKFTTDENIDFNISITEVEFDENDTLFVELINNTEIDTPEN